MHANAFILWSLFAWAGLIGELLIPCLLLNGRTRIWAFWIGCFFHIGILGITRLGPSLHIMMLLSYLLFVSEPAEPIAVRVPETWKPLLARLDWWSRLQLEGDPSLRVPARKTLLLLGCHVPVLNPIAVFWGLAGVGFVAYVALKYFA